MGRIAVHEFITLDGVFENPAWSFGYPFDPKMGGAIGGIMGGSAAILLGRRSYEQFAPAWSTSCTCSSTRWCTAPATGCSRRTVPSSSSP